jgi:uncharacterized membrane protein YphA (DoxX/SURF4 family)
MAITLDAIKHSPAPSKTLKTSLWIAQVYLAAMFGIAGFVKTFLPVPDMVANGITFAPDVPLWLTRFIGVAELSGAIGIILPSLTRIAPRLTWKAASGFVAIQVLAIGFHATRGELARALPMNLALLLPAMFVLWGRTVKAPLVPRQ